MEYKNKSTLFLHISVSVTLPGAKSSGYDTYMIYVYCCLLIQFMFTLIYYKTINN